MKRLKSKYPAFNVLNEKDEWDEHTREIVLSRVEPDVQHYSALSVYQAEVVKKAAAALVYDDREEILKFIVNHLDKTLGSTVGEGQRKVGIPPQKDLMLKGLEMLDKISQDQFTWRFIELDTRKQEAVLELLDKGEAPVTLGWDKKMQQAFFQKILSIVVRAYYSHPTVWSEIGYAGPAYPRGYVRSELGLTDPWEAKNNES
jgi:hypothetical protein